MVTLKAPLLVSLVLRHTFPLVGLVLLLPLLVSGCADEPAAEVRLEVQSARIEAVDCLDGEATGPGACHVLVVRVHNEHQEADAHLSPSAWRAIDDRSGNHTMPQVQGETKIGPGTATTIGLGFSAPAEARFITLHYEGPSGGRAEAPVPAYS